MRNGRWILCAIVVLGFASPACAFNGLRKGFVLGGGLGLAPSTTWKADAGDFGEVEETKVGAASNIFLGYGWDEQNLLVFEANGISTMSDKFMHGVGTVRDVTIAQGYSGPVWYHYFGPTAPGFFTAAGIGFFSFYYDIEDGKEDANDSGLGLLGGVGYEFSRHWQVVLVINGGQTSELGVDYTHLNIETLINVVAF